MKNWHKAIIASAVAVVLVILITANVNKSMNEKAEKAIAEMKAEEEVREELYLDAKQVFEVLEEARGEQRGLTYDEELLMKEFKAKYDRESMELTHYESGVVSNLILMSYETIPRSKLNTNKNRYEEYKESLFYYIDFKP